MKKKFIYARVGQKCSFLETSTSKEVRGMRARLCNILNNANGNVVSFVDICKETHCSEPDYFILRSIDVHVTYLNKFFAEFDYKIKRVSKQGFKLEKL